MAAAMSFSSAARAASASPPMPAARAGPLAVFRAADLAAALPAASVGFFLDVGIVGSFFRHEMERDLISLLELPMSAMTASGVRQLASRCPAGGGRLSDCLEPTEGADDEHVRNARSVTRRAAGP